MPRPERIQRRGTSPQDARGQEPRPQKGKPEQAGRLDADVRALISTMNVFNQKISLIERNEKIIGRNIIVLNKKLKELRQTSSVDSLPANVQEIVNSMEKKVSEAQQQMNSLRETIAELKT